MYNHTFQYKNVVCIKIKWELWKSAGLSFKEKLAYILIHISEQLSVWFVVAVAYATCINQKDYY